MDLRLDATEQLLRDNARTMLAEIAPPEALRAWEEGDLGYSPVVWERMAKLGWMDIRSSGDGVFSLGLLIEELGRAALPSPFLVTVGDAATVLQCLGSGAASTTCLRKIADVGSPAVLLHDSRIMGRSIDGRVVIDGPEIIREWAHVAEALVVLARDAGGGGYWLAVVDPAHPGVEIRAYDSFDNERIAGVRLRGVEIDEGGLGAPEPVGEEGVRHAYALTRLFRCSEMVGGAQRALDLTVDYAKNRHQFGVAIGSFQAMQHQLANLAIAVDAARLATYEGLSEAGHGASCLKSSALSVHLCARAYVQAAVDGAQFHGGIGAMRDHPMNLYYRRAKAMQLRLGSPAEQRANLARTHLMSA